MTKQYGCLPSDILGIEDNYTAYCFNEACSLLMYKLENKEIPSYAEDREEKSYSSPEEFYKSLGV